MRTGRALATTVVDPFAVGDVGEGGAGLLVAEERVVVVGDVGSGKGLG